MSRECKLGLSNFSYQDRFELHSYLTYLFQQFHGEVPDQSENKI
jgi:hypothetical protein